MVPGWRKGTAVLTFKKGNEREESDGGQSQPLPNQLQPGASREAAEAAEDRDKIISVRGGFVSFMRRAQSGSPGPKPAFLLGVRKLLAVTAVLVWNITLNTRVHL